MTETNKSLQDCEKALSATIVEVALLQHRLLGTRSAFNRRGDGETFERFLHEARSDTDLLELQARVVQSTLDLAKQYAQDAMTAFRKVAA